ncbi:hypothetical protein [Formosa maritima]|uniref:Uncharacterized protein n=1 Tax=Formosa maritima TaxID=2592046 RepID=A0A5D0GLA3_9FLAO|nr:hypothetical protein [Formosa maritima]TYA59119.1 hypothetical protein FVF61_02920 [Formosa maritima]
MIQLMSLNKCQYILLIEQKSIVTALSISVVFFLILLILGLRKSYKLRQENEELSKAGSLDVDEEKKAYRDFTESHMYDNN